MGRRESWAARQEGELSQRELVRLSGHLQDGVCAPAWDEGTSRSEMTVPGPGNLEPNVLCRHIGAAGPTKARDSSSC